MTNRIFPLRYHRTAIIKSASLLLAGAALAACDNGTATAPVVPSEMSASRSTTLRHAYENLNPASQPKGGTPDAPGMAPRFAYAVSEPVPASVIVTYQGLDWVWASPCAQNGCTSGILLGKDGFNFATADQWIKRPPMSMMNGKCAAPWFDKSHNHCDFGDGFAGYVGSVPAYGTGQIGTAMRSMSPYAETWLVRQLAPADSSPPAIASTATGTSGSNGWYTSDVSVTWSVTDAESDVTAKSGCEAASVTTDTHGVTFTCSATSAGGTATESVTVKRDAALPVITYTGNAGTYTVDQTVAITCAASDATSGIASDTCENVSGTAYSFKLGSNTFSATAIDHAGNTGSGSTTFTVNVTFGSLCTLTQRFVSQQGIANALCQKLDAAAASAARGNDTAKDGQLKAFVNQVQAQTGKAISTAESATLIRLANAL